MDKKKLLFVTWSLTQGGGEARSVTNILNNLNLDKYQIEVFELNRGLKPIEVIDSIDFCEPIVDYRNMDSIKKEKVKLTHYMRYPEEIAERFTTVYDCVIACNRGVTSLLSSFIPAYKKIVWIRGSVDNLNSDNFADQSIKDIIVKEHDKQADIFNKYDKIVVVSDSLYDSFNIIFSEHKDKVVKIYNSIDPATVEEKANCDVVGYQPHTQNTLINVGRLREVKNQKLLIDAMKIVTEEIKDIELLIIGEGLLKESLQSYIDENNLGNYVRLVGFYENPFPLLKKGKIFCLSSISEGFCLAISEACVLGLPFVSTNVGGAQELLNSAQCGFIVNNDPQEYANKIKELLTSEDLYNDFKKNCYIASTRFSAKQLGLQVERLIDEIIKD